jgi:hypothetical protein
MAKDCDGVRRHAGRRTSQHDYGDSLNARFACLPAPTRAPHNPQCLAELTHSGGLAKCEWELEPGILMFYVRMMHESHTRLGP